MLSQNPKEKTFRGLRQIVVSAFAIVGITILLNEVLDLPHLLFSAAITPVNWVEIGIEAVLVLLVGWLCVRLLNLLESKQQQAEVRIEHLNSVLRAIKNVNQLIILEKDRDVLLQKVCDSLVEARGYEATWLGFLSDGNAFTTVVGSGFSKGVSLFRESVMSGEHPSCIRMALTRKSDIIVVDKSGECADCFFKNACANKDAAIIRVEHEKRFFGLLAVLFAPDVAVDEEEKELLKEVAGDIAFALYSMELEEARKHTEEALKEYSKRLEEMAEERKQAGDRLAKEMTAVATVVNDMLRGEVDDAETEKRVLDACLVATDSVYGMIGVINEHGKYDTTTYSSQTLQDCAFPEALAWEVSTGMTIRGIWGWPMLKGEPLLCNDLKAHPDRVGLPKGHVQLDCFLGVPLKREGKVVGMVAVANKPGGYTQEDRDALIRLASVISVSRQHRLALIAAKRTSVELEQLVAERTRQLQEAQDGLEELVEERTKELREAQERLLHSEKLAVLGQLAGGVGHELRNPLGAIKNAAYFLNMAIEEPEPEVKETLEILEREVATSERIISSLLGFARPKPPSLRKVDINNLVRETLPRVAVPENVEVATELQSLPGILADPDQLGQVFGNILSNGIQAMSQGGRLVIKSGTRDPGWVTISITDTGVGMPEEVRQKVFEPLFTTKAKGIGLGLAVSRTLVEGNGGTIDVKSEVGKGSTFTLRLPIGGKERELHE